MNDAKRSAEDLAILEQLNTKDSFAISGTSPGPQATRRSGPPSSTRQLK